MSGRIFKVSMPREDEEEQAREYVSSQGWEGDLSWIFYSHRETEGQAAKSLPGELLDINKARHLLWKDDDKRASNTFKNLFSKEGIMKGDLVMLYLGKGEARYIAEIPDDYVYYFNQKLQYGNCLFPVKYYKIDDVFKNKDKIKLASMKGVQGIENYRGDRNYIIDNWNKYKVDKNISSVFPEEKRAEFNSIKAKLPDIIEYSKRIILKILAGERIKPMLDLLLANKQLILTGAPGTGKTYTAKQIVHREILGDNTLNVTYEQLSDDEKNELNVRHQFIQFHQTYDYTDFVEGLKPTMVGTESSSNSIGFELRNGIFKEFCRRAGLPERIKAAGQKIEDATIDKFLLNDEEGKKYWKNWKVGKEIDSVANINNLPVINKGNKIDNQFEYNDELKKGAEKMAKLRRGESL
jgi:hypothetical protein